MINFVSIDTETKQNKRLPIDIEHMRDRFVSENELVTFPSPSFETIDKHVFYLLKYSIEKPLDIKYQMRPDYLSFDEYGTVILSKLLMYVNGIMTVEEFTMDYVIVPKLNAIINILPDKFNIDRQYDELIKVNW